MKYVFFIVLVALICFAVVRWLNANVGGIAALGDQGATVSERQR